MTSLMLLDSDERWIKFGTVVASSAVAFTIRKGGFSAGGRSVQMVSAIMPNVSGPSSSGGGVDNRSLNDQTQWVEGYCPLRIEEKLEAV
jgi:hypothetical protein